MIKVCPVCGRKNDGEGAVPLCHISLCQEAYEALTAERDRYKTALGKIAVRLQGIPTSELSFRACLADIFDIVAESQK